MLRILVIDPHEKRTEACRAVLEFPEYQCTIESDPKNFGTHFATESDPDIVFLVSADENCSMLDVFHGLKERNAHLPLVALSITKIKNTDAREIEAGASHASVFRFDIQTLNMPYNRSRFTETIAILAIRRGPWSCFVTWLAVARKFARCDV